jgi:integrase
MIRSSVIINVSMCLADLLDAYVASRETSKRYRESLLRTVRKATNAGLTSVDSLTPVQVNRFLASLSTALSPTTRHNIRRELLTLWRYAFEEGLTEAMPIRIAKIKPSYASPQAYSASDLERLLHAASTDVTKVGGLTAARVCDLMPAWIGIAYESGLRFEDVLELSFSDIRNGTVTTKANKTRKALVRGLSAGTLQDISELKSKSTNGTLFLWALTRRRAVKVWRSFLDRHGFEGSSKWLRRSCATYVEMKTPGSATRYLQHSNPTLVTNHYFDESLFAVPEGPPPIRRQMCGERE